MSTMHSPRRTTNATRTTQGNAGQRGSTRVMERGPGSYPAGAGWHSMKSCLSALVDDVNRLSRDLAKTRVTKTDSLHLFQTPESETLQGILSGERWHVIRRFAGYQVCHACYVWLSQNVWGSARHTGVLKHLMVGDSQRYNWNLYRAVSGGENNMEGVDHAGIDAAIASAAHIFVDRLSRQLGLPHHVDAATASQRFDTAHRIVRSGICFAAVVKASSPDVFISSTSTFPLYGSVSFDVGSLPMDELDALRRTLPEDRQYKSVELEVPGLASSRVLYATAPYVMLRSTGNILFAGSEVILVGGEPPRTPF